MAMITTIEQAREFRSNMDKQSELCQPFAFTMTIKAKPAATTVVNMPIPEGADFQMLGYNGEYDAAANGLECLKILFKQKIGNRVWANDPEPVKSILTPGIRSVTPIARYGYRQFAGRLRSNDQITAEVTNSNQNETLEVVITFIGVLWFVK